MTARTAVELGLVVGCLAGILAHGARWVPEVPMELAYRPAPPTALEIEQPWQDRPRVRLVEQSRVGLRDPQGDYNTATLWRVDFRGADLREADLRQADIRGCDFRGANLEHADLTDAIFDSATRWPPGFDPALHGATLNPPATAMTPLDCGPNWARLDVLGLRAGIVKPSWRTDTWYTGSSASVCARLGARLEECTRLGVLI